MKGYPLDKHDKAFQTAIKKAELLSEEWDDPRNTFGMTLYIWRAVDVGCARTSP